MKKVRVVVLSLLLPSFIATTPICAASKKSKSKTQAKSAKATSKKPVKKLSKADQIIELCDRAADLQSRWRFAESEKLWRSVLRIEPRHEDAHAWLGQALWRQNKKVEAEKILVSALKLDIQPDENAFYLLHETLGEIFLSTQRYEQATISYRKAFNIGFEEEEVEAGYLKSLTEWGLSLDKAQRWHDSENVWRELLKIQSKNTKAQFLLAASLMQQGKHKEAEDFLKKVVTATPKLDDHRMALVNALVQQNKDNEAITHLRQLITRRYKEPLTRSTLAQILILQGKHKEAESELRLAIKADPRDGELYVSLADCLLELERPNEARQAAQKARQLGLKEHEALDEIEKKLVVPSTNTTAPAADSTPLATP
jgi:tetratricopeptide (TPR) repeat protein